MKKALVIIDIQNDITKNYKEIIQNLNDAIDWAVQKGIHVIYIRHENLSSKTRTFKPNTNGSKLADDLHIVSNNIFTKYKGNALSSEAFLNFIMEHDIQEFYLTGGDAAACVKSTVYNLLKAHYHVTVLKDCITCYNKQKIEEMLEYYESKGAVLCSLQEVINGEIHTTI